ncbi:MAG: hypothetical protein ABSE92_04195 [Terriglobales bacterium]|jgi:DNA repair exonuclease SbcCD ATPase subunit
MTNPVEKYLTALERFNQALTELNSKYEQANVAREEALQASADLRRELEVNEQRVQDISSIFHQPAGLNFHARSISPAQAQAMPEMRRAS